MDYLHDTSPDAAALTALFLETFTASEGAGEGAAVSGLVAALLSEGVAQVFTARQGAALAGAILFTPLVYAGAARQVMLLSPVAVAPGWQGQGVGQALIRFGLEALRSQGVALAVTYGDPAFYSRVGFQPVTEAQVPAPHPLSMPQGWQAVALNGGALAPLAGPCTCAAAFDAPGLW